MLTMYLNIIPKGIEHVYEKDVEKLFSTLKLECTEENKKIVRDLEGGTLLDESSFIDRFGFRLNLENLSTGCKAALCVANFKNRVIDLLECGLNARDYIITGLSSGNVLVRDNGITICDSESINVQLDGYLFTNIDRLNYYVSDERPYKPDMSLGGIYKLEEESNILFIDKYTPELIFDLSPGVYVFEQKSGIGKTRLAKAIKESHVHKERVASYSYEDFLSGVPISSVLNTKYDVVMLDRYDIYNGEGRSLIEELSDKVAILIDCKGTQVFYVMRSIAK